MFLPIFNPYYEDFQPILNNHIQDIIQTIVNYHWFRLTNESDLGPLYYLLKYKFRQKPQPHLGKQRVRNFRGEEDLSKV